MQQAEKGADGERSYYIQQIDCIAACRTNNLKLPSIAHGTGAVVGTRGCGSGYRDGTPHLPVVETSEV